MRIQASVFAAALMVVAGAHAQSATDVDATVQAVKAANPDMRSLCQKGPDGMRAAVGQAIASLASQGKVQGNPQEVGNAAGQRLGRECRGG